MWKPILLMLLLFASMVTSAQDYVNVTFTANTTDGLYCPFTTVNATNVTRGWTETLTYPDTVLVLANTVGLDEHKEKAFHLGEAFPNPFNGETYAFLELSEDSDVLLQLIRVDGVVVASRKLHLAFGTSRVTVRMSAAHLAFLSATTNYGRQVIKLVHMGHGATDALDVDFVSTATKSLDNPFPMRFDVTGEFEPGDMMRYEAQLMDGGVTIYSAPVTQPQYDDETITFLFALAMPSVMTAGVTEITNNSALVGGTITNDGNGIISARGISYKTFGEDNWTDIDIASTEATFSTTLSLSPSTNYVVRAYATNEVGTAYGEEVNFTTLEDAPAIPEGAINGLFTINANGDQVYFSQGNLQYIKSTGVWSFMEHQYDIVETNWQTVGNNYGGQDVVSLFGWGTSGWNSGANCYQPWSTSTIYIDYLPGGSCTNNLTGSYANADWGVYNAISNGGNQAGLWRTLTTDEWVYVFNTRSTASGIRYAKACVNNVNGVILLPDEWSSSYYSLGSTNNGGPSFSSNTITLSQWDTLEQHGAVFLPAAGSRNGASVSDVGISGNYWSASYCQCFAYCVSFGSMILLSQDCLGRGGGGPVRLVCPAE